MMATGWLRPLTLVLSLAAAVSPAGHAAAQTGADSAAVTISARVILPAPARTGARAVGVTISGRVLPAGGGDVRGLRVLARVGVAADSAAVDSTGRFSIALAGGRDSVDLWVDAADTTARTFAPARLRIAAADVGRGQEIVLVPLRWTIRGGRYAGTVVDVPLERAFRGMCRDCTGFYRRVTSHADTGRVLLSGWPASRLPLRVAFDRDWNGQRLSAADSVAFWREADDLNQALGVEVFRPVDFASTAPRADGGPRDVILVWLDPDMRGLSGLGTAVSSRDDIEYGDVRLNPATLRETDVTHGLVEHELMHTLGFGHTCAWPSVLADVRRCPEQRADAATREDVAYAQLASAIRELVRENGHRWGVEAAIAAMGMPLTPALAAR
jgi:uncharacterized protein YfaQ (DUF2300 family)